MPRRRVLCYLTECQRFRFHLQVDVCVDVRRGERDMPQPRTDRVDVDAGPQEVSRRGVSNRVGADSFGGERRYMRPCLADMAFHERVNSESRDGLAAAIEKHAFGTRA